MILLDSKMVSMDLTALSFSSLAKSQEVEEQHGSSIELAGYIGKIDIHVFYYSQYNTRLHMFPILYFKHFFFYCSEHGILCKLMFFH